jgi:hypothetical protein
MLIFLLKYCPCVQINYGGKYNTLTRGSCYACVEKLLHTDLVFST